MHAYGFETADGFLSAGGKDTFVKWQIDLGTRDFDLSSSFKVNEVAFTGLSFVLWASDRKMHIGLDGSDSHLVREGGSWGSASISDSGLETTPVKANTMHTLRLQRTSRKLSVSFDGNRVPGWRPSTSIISRPFYTSISNSVLHCDTNSVGLRSQS